MKGWLLDTNVVAALISPNGAPSVRRWASDQDEDKLYISVLTLAEYDKGIYRLPADHPHRSRYIAARDSMADRFAGRVLSLDDKTVRRWGQISGEVKRTGGAAPPVIDTLLAATAIEQRLYLVTRNVKDTRPSGAAIFDPWNEDPRDYPISPSA